MAKQLARPAPVGIGNLYDDDPYAWSLEQVASLRAGNVKALDLENIAEELESLGIELKRGLRSAYRVLLIHLLEWRYQPERRSDSWSETIVRERNNALERMDESPSLAQHQSRLSAEAYRAARREAAAETKLPLATFPTECPFTLEQALDDGFWPEAAGTSAKEAQP